MRRESSSLFPAFPFVVSVSGDVFVRDQIKRLVKVGAVDFLHDDSRGNPVVEYLHRNGTPQGLMTPLPNDGYTMPTPSGLTVFNSPATNEPYSKISGDFNPIHVNPYFSDFASLPGTITHGMWSSAATRRFIETVVAQGRPDRVVAYVVAVLINIDRADFFPFIDTTSLLSVWSCPATS